MSDNIPEWLRPYCTQNSYTPTEEDIESLDPQSRNEMLLKYFALNYSDGGGGDSNAAFKALVDGSITEVTADMLQGVTNIKLFVFVNCSSLTSIIIPSSVTSIRTSAFENCTSLVSVTIEATNPPSVDGSVFRNTSSNLVIYVPAESVNAYKSASGWSNYASKIQAIPN